MCLTPRSALALGTALLKKHFNAFYNLTSKKHFSALLNKKENRKTDGLAQQIGREASQFAAKA